MRTIYKILDPITHEVRYIGVTKLQLRKRLGIHVRKAREEICKSKFYRWLKELNAQGIKPIIEPIMQVPIKDSFYAELVLIQAFKIVGHPLLNTYKMY